MGDSSTLWTLQMSFTLWVIRPLYGLCRYSHPMGDPFTLWILVVICTHGYSSLNLIRKTWLCLNNSSLKRKCVCRKSTYPLGLKKAQNIVAKIIKGKLVIVAKLK